MIVLTWWVPLHLSVDLTLSFLEPSVKPNQNITFKRLKTKRVGILILLLQIECPKNTTLVTHFVILSWNPCKHVTRFYFVLIIEALHLINKMSLFLNFLRQKYLSYALILFIIKFHIYWKLPLRIILNLTITIKKQVSFYRVRMCVSVIKRRTRL